MKYKIETERCDLFDVNILITMKVVLNQTVPFSDVKMAFNKACKVHEVLQSRVIIEASGEAYYIENASPYSSISETGLSLEELINENERLRFRIELGEYIRAFSSPEGLIFMMHHLGGDGKSLLYFIETFMKCLTGQTIEPVPFKAIDTASIPKSCKVPFFYRSLVESWNRKWRRDKKVFTFTDMDKAYSEFWKNHKTKVSLKRYDSAELAKLLQKAKALNVSLTAYLITEMIRKSDRIMDIGLAVDGRLDNNRSMGNQATGISIKYRYNNKKSFEANAQAVHKLMKKKLTSNTYRYFVLKFMGSMDPTLKDTLNLERSGYFSSKHTSKIADVLGYGKKVKDLSITNLTKADIPLIYGEYEIKEIVFIPPVISYGKNIIGIVTTGDVMNITRHTYE